MLALEFRYKVFLTYFLKDKTQCFGDVKLFEVVICRIMNHSRNASDVEDIGKDLSY